MNIGATEIFIILIVLFLLFGSKRMGQMAKKAGEATKEFKKVKNDFTDAFTETKTVINKEIKEIDQSVKKLTNKP